MTEKRVFELLSQIYPDVDDPSPSFNEYSRLIPEHVEHISKRIAKSIYDTLKENNSVSENKRKDFIQIIRRWCNKDNNHFSVDQNNYEFLLERYVSQSRKDDLDVLLTGLYGDFEDLPPDNVTDELRLFYNKYDMKMLEKQRQLDYNNEMDRKILGDSQFFTNRSHIKLDSIDKFLNNFLSQNTMTENRVLSNKPETRVNALEMSRGDKVKFVYAILNLKRDDKNLRILSKILEEISIEKDKNASEVELAKYLWHTELTNQLHFNILNLFPFLYEVPVINLCKELIEICNEVEKVSLIEKFQQEHSEVIQKSKSSKNLKFKIINMLNELFILSEYNEVLLQVIKLFNT